LRIRSLPTPRRMRMFSCVTHSHRSSYPLLLRHVEGGTALLPFPSSRVQVKRGGGMPASSCPCRRRQNLRNFQPVPNVSPVVSSSRARRQLRSAVRSAPTIDMQGRNCECRSSTAIRGRQARTQRLPYSNFPVLGFAVTDSDVL